MEVSYANARRGHRFPWKIRNSMARCRNPLNIVNISYRSFRRRLGPGQPTRLFAVLHHAAYRGVCL